MAILDNGSFEDTVSWLPSGLGFIIKDRKRFAKEVMPHFFQKKSTKASTSDTITSNVTVSNDDTGKENVQFSSFTRRLNRWCFIHRPRGNDQSQYFHPLFVRDAHDKCLKMRPKPQVCYRKKSKNKRQQIKKQTENEIIHSRHYLPDLYIPRSHCEPHEMPYYTNSSRCLPPFAPHGLSMSVGAVTSGPPDVNHLPNQGNVPFNTMIGFPRKMGGSNASIVSEERSSPFEYQHKHMSAAASSNPKLYAANGNAAPQFFIPPTSMADESMLLNSRIRYSKFPQGTTMENHGSMMNSTSTPFDSCPQALYCPQKQTPQHFPARHNIFSGLVGGDKQQNHYTFKEQQPTMEAPYYRSDKLPPSMHQRRYISSNMHEYHNLELANGATFTRHQEYRRLLMPREQEKLR